MRLEYPAKVLIAWGEAISGNREIRDWLIKNGYPELGIFTFALRNKQDARAWLMKNGPAHLMAVITGIEGDEAALKWLDTHGMHVLKHVALTGDGDQDAFKWLVQNGHRELAVIGTKMNKVKRDLDDQYGDYHGAGRRPLLHDHRTHVPRLARACRAARCRSRCARPWARSTPNAPPSSPRPACRW